MNTRTETVETALEEACIALRKARAARKPSKVRDHIFHAEDVLGSVVEALMGEDAMELSVDLDVDEDGNDLPDEEGPED